MSVLDRLMFNDLKAALVAKANFELQNQNKANLRLNAAMGIPNEPPMPLVVALQSENTDYAAGIVAKRLLEDDRTIALISSDDGDELVAHILNFATDEMMAAADDELKSPQDFAEVRKILGRNMRIGYDFTLRVLNAITESSCDQYDNYHKYLEVLLAITEERDLNLENAIFQDGVADEVNRRLYSRNEFLDLGTRLVDTTLDFDEIIKTIIIASGATIESAPEGAVAELRTTLEPRFAAAYRESLVMLVEEADRIYGPETAE